MKNSKGALLIPFLIAFSATGKAQTTHSVQETAPRLVVSILVDGLRSDYMEAFRPLFGTDGLRRLMDGGQVYANASSASDFADRAAATASLATGAAPADHGIVALRWFDRQTARPIAAVEDATAKGVNTSETASPVHLVVSTLGDELKVATEGKALVYAVAPFSDAAILSAGHAADAALWIDGKTGQWCTTDYYGALPAVANARSKMQPVTDRLKREKWQPVTPLVGNFSYFLGRGVKQPFSHDLSTLASFEAFKTSALINEEVAAMAESCVTNTMLGADDVTDYLALSLYAGTFLHQPVSSAGMELQDTYVRLDRAVASLINAVEKKVGIDRALFVLTSTGTEEEDTENPEAYRLPGGTLDMKRTAGLLNMYLAALYGGGQYVDGAFGTQIYLNHQTLEDRHLAVSEVMTRAEDFLLQVRGVKDVYTSRRLLQGAWTPGLSRIRAAYNASVSGDILIEVSPGWKYINEDTKESRLVRASFVPFPIVFYGYGISPKVIETPVSTDCIAPTLSKAMRIRAPSACKAAPLSLNNK